jgi:hypothetical protein
VAVSLANALSQGKSFPQIPTRVNRDWTKACEGRAAVDSRSPRFRKAMNFM